MRRLEGFWAVLMAVVGGVQSLYFQMEKIKGLGIHHDGLNLQPQIYCICECVYIAFNVRKSTKRHTIQAASQTILRDILDTPFSLSVKIMGISCR